MGKTNPGKTSKGNSTAKTRKNAGAFQLTPEPLPRATDDDLAAHKFDIAAPQSEADETEDEATAEPAFEQTGELPQSYGTTTLFLIARDPHWLFSYWDIDWSAYPSSAMRNAERKFFLKLFTNEGREELATEINPEAKNWYLPVTKPGETYRAEIGFYNQNGEWQSVAASEPASVPADVISEEMEASFATVPMHLTFERLLEMVRNTMREGETLMQALARLQGEGRKLAFGTGTAPDWTDEQRQVLAALFGSELVERIGMGSAEIDQLLRKELLEKLNTESASELVAKARELGLPGVSSLFSGFGEFGALGAFSSGLFSASLLGALGAWGSEVSSWLAGLSALSASGSEVSSWLAGLSGVGAWGAWSSEVTSWSTALGSSWSAQPFSEQQSREFFMHVNAEVIFYGGTHPDAKVWIDGREVKLNPDGTFRYHFRFPDGNYEIPIVAESPDGVEQRSAFLTFERTTSRKGEIGSTAQPEHLTAPIGQTAA